MKKQDDEWSDWSGYTDFEFRWLENILARSALRRADLLRLADQFGVHFTEEDWRTNLEQKEIGGVILNHAERDELLPAVEELLATKYPDWLTFEQARTLHQNLEALESEILKKVVAAITRDRQLKAALLQTPHFNDRSGNQLALLAVEQLYNHE